MQSRSYDFGEVFFSICKEANTPRSLSMYLQFKYAMHADLVRRDLDPSDYNELHSFRKDYFVWSYARKYIGLDTGIDTEDVALKSFIGSEETCRETNIFLRSLESGLVNPRNRRGNALIYKASRKISEILGRFSLEKVSRCGWTVGASTQFSRVRSFLDDKIHSYPHCSSSAAPYLEHQMAIDPHWLECIYGLPWGTLVGESYSDLVNLSHDVIVRDEANVIKTVPKSAKTDRVIAVEPQGNQFLQKGVGNYIRSRLKRFGVDLDTQKRNQDLARRAFDEGLATLDLSAASDSISIELVRCLLPYDWFEYLDKIRSRNYILDGNVYRYHKFSSMGNGFTFELESLIFFAMASAVVKEGEISVFGDDIIVPAAYYQDLVEFLSLMGFSVNKAKSFSKGNFYESCGKHYYEKVDVTPVYQADLVTDEASFIRAHNRLMRGLLRGHSCANACALLYRIYRERRGRHFVPLSREADDGVMVHDSILRELYTYDRNHGFLCKVLTARARSFFASDAALLAYTLRFGGNSQGFLGKVSCSLTDLVSRSAWINPGLGPV